MPVNDLKFSYDGVCVYVTTTVKAGITAKIILSFINLVLLGIIILFTVEHIFIASIVFFGFELLVIKYTLWNLLGEERLIINAKSLNYQQHYGFFTTSLHTINFNKKIIIRPYEEVFEADVKYSKFLFESYDENNLPIVIYQSVLNIATDSFAKLVMQIEQLFLDEMVTSNGMPAIYLN